MRAERPRLADRLGRSTARELFGRERELELLTAQCSESGAVVTFVHGIGGIGKTSLLAAVRPRLLTAGARVLAMDGRMIEPTARGFLQALARALGALELDGPEAVATELERDPATTVLLVDEFDHLRLLDDWMIHSLLPVLPERTRWIVAGRFAPRSVWLASPGWSDAVLSLRLDALDEASARAFLTRRGVRDSAIPELLAMACGNPLALALVAPRTESSGATEGVNESAVLATLARHWVDALSPALREAVEAGSVVRRVTRDLLQAMLGGCDGLLLSELAELPFVEHTEHGLTIHETVRHALAARLRAIEPARYLRLRRSAWRALEATLANAQPSGPHAWRLTADVLFVVEHPEIREAFFPSKDLGIAVDSALDEDHPALEAIVRRHEQPGWLPVFESWWRLARSAFRVAREATGRVLGFVIIAPSHTLPEALAEADPLLRLWQDDLRSGPGSQRGALFIRRALSGDAGECISEVRAAIWLDAKRLYVERPAQWALYVGTRHADGLFPRLEQLGFARTSLAHGDEQTAHLEFGASGIWSWLRRLANATELGEHTEREGATDRVSWQLDEASRGLWVDGVHLPLSSLEYHTLEYLLGKAGEVVTRDELLETVWQQRHTGSNVVDAVVRLLRKKLGPHAAELETVRGHGYRLQRRQSARQPASPEA